MKYLFLFIGLFLLVGCTYDVVDDTHLITGDLNVTGDTNFNLHYAEAYYQSYSNPLTISIASADTYYNVTGYNVSYLNGVTLSGNDAVIARDGVYKVTGHLSFSGGNQGTYEMELFVNGVGRPECTFFRTTSSTAIGDASVSCIEDLSAGDKLIFKIKDIQAPAQDVSIYIMNLHIFEIP